MTRRGAVRAADKAFSDYIRTRDGWRCVVCGRTRETASIQCGHLFSRTSYSTRWSETNAVAQCAACNMRHEYDPWPLTLVYLDRDGQEAIDNLHDIHHRTRKYTTDEIQDIAKDFRRRLKILEEERDARY